jgi:hypothetical protein
MCAILLYMTVVTWAMLPKSQIDNETIEQMVERKIAEHEENANSHLGVGESIDVHRKTEIVDHLAGSVLNDKFTMKEFSYTNQFWNLDNIYTIDEVSVEQNALRLYIETGYGPKSVAHIEFLRPQPFMTLEKDFLVQFLAQVDTSNTNGKIYMGFNNVSSGLAYNFIGFERINGVVKARAQLGGTPFVSSTISVDMSEPHIYRLQHITGEKKIYFYIDGQLQAEHTYTTETLSEDAGAYFHHEVTGSNDGTLYIMDLFVSRGM